MKNTYCTLFNYDYLTRGLTLYRSMERCISDFRLYILAMDRETALILREQNLPNALIITLEDVMNEELKKSLGNRDGSAFFWSCTPLIIEYILNVMKEQWVTYLDADCYMLKDPSKVFDIMEEKGYSVGIVEHRFRKDRSYDKLCAMNGRFNVAFNTFRNEKNSLRILTEWKMQCIERCESKPTGEVFGDQMYLSEWPDKYEQVYVIEDEGINVAPWNVNNYRFYRSNDSYMIEDESGNCEVSMFHFHAMRFLSAHLVSLNLWNTRSRAEERGVFELYKQYILELREHQKVVNRYPRFFRPTQNEGVWKRIRTLFFKYRNRDENNLLALFRNVMWI